MLFIKGSKRQEREELKKIMYIWVLWPKSSPRTGMLCYRNTGHNQGKKYSRKQKIPEAKPKSIRNQKELLLTRRMR